jgi:hypothetical protein
MAKKPELIWSFIKEVQEDPRISTVHISLYMALAYEWAAQGRSFPVSFKARALMPAAKIRGRGLFHRTIRQLHEYGYLRYEPSFKPDEPSKVWLDPERTDRRTRSVAGRGLHRGLQKAPSVRARY